VNLKKIIIGLSAMLTVGTVSAQPVLIRGRVIDKQTREAVIAATITTNQFKGTTSDVQGRFALEVEKLPVVLSVSHVSYGRMTVTVSKQATELVIRMERNVTQIPEVRVTATKNKVQVLNRKTRYTITDYQFEGPNMWFIGCMDNSPKGVRLYLGDPYGDTVCSVPIVNDVRLYRDYFGKIHLVRPDSVFQLFADGDSIQLLYPESKGKFMELMSAYEVAFNNGLVRLSYNPYIDVLSLHYVDSTMKVPQKVFLNSREGKGYLEKRYAWMGRYFGPRTLRLIVSQQKSDYLREMRSTVYALQDTLYVINLKDNQLHVFGKNLNEIRIVPLTFYFRETDDITNAYVPFRTITDPVKNQIYIIFNINSHFTIKPLDTQTGQLGPEIFLPRYSAMDRISIHDNALYYIYPEKVFPYYQRLFRMGLT